MLVCTDNNEAEKVQLPSVIEAKAIWVTNHAVKKILYVFNTVQPQTTVSQLEQLFVSEPYCLEQIM